MCEGGALSRFLPTGNLMRDTFCIILKLYGPKHGARFLEAQGVQKCQSRRGQGGERANGHWS
jgi:hypothetical protein